MKTIIVTGDSGGLGKQIVETLFDATDYRVVGISRSENENINALKSIYGERYTHICFDLSKTEDIKTLYIEELKKTGPIYGLVNNSAHAYDDIITNANLSELETMYSVNVFVLRQDN